MKKKNVIVLLLGVAMLATAFVGCKGKDDSALDTDIIHNPNSAEGYDKSEKMPIMEVETNMHDFGRLTAGENISYSFKFVNKGNADLIISGCEATCGCTVADYPKERIKPGDGGYITVSFNSTGKSGQQFQEVTVASNAQPSKVKLRIRAEVM
jgi:hypothetical protein